MYTYDELVFYVTAANIAGYMEEKGEIAINDDDKLTSFIGEQLDLYKAAEERAELDGTDYPVWRDWIQNALLNEYGDQEDNK